MNKQPNSPWESFHVNIPKSSSEVLKTQYKRLQAISPALEDPLDLKETLSAISKAIEENRLTPHDVADVKQDQLISQDINFRQLCQFHFACISFLCAEKRLASGDEKAAWPLICNTSYLIGVTEDGLFLAAKGKEARRKAEAGKPGRQKGGAATKAKYDKVRKVMVDLLETHAPPEGWLTKKQAVDTIYDDLALSVEHLDLTFPDIHETALKWLRESGIVEINTAYEKTKLSNKSNN